MEIGRNDLCHCGSGKKYKKCHLEKDETENRKAREKAALNAAKVAEAAAKTAEQSGEKKTPAAAQAADKGGWMSKVAGKMGFKGAQQRRTPQNKGG